MKYFIAICLIIILIACSKADKNQSKNNELTIEEKETPSSAELSIAWEEKLKYSGTILHSIINDDNVNVRSYPSLKADVLFRLNKNTGIKVIGISKNTDTIDNYSGNWLNIILEDKWESGWVFSRYIENGKFTASEISIIELIPINENTSQKLICSNQGKIITLYPHKEKNQDFYTFAYNYEHESFCYNNIPGSYVWYPETKELKHISYIGTNMESAWVIFTDDFKYIIEDFGTAPPPRALGVWRVEDAKEIFSGMYSRDINLQEHIITIIYQYNDWNISNNKLDDEILEYAKSFRESTPEPVEMVQYSKETGFGLELIIICELNLDTGGRKIINGKYIHTQ